MGVLSIAAAGTRELVKRRVVIEGITPIMFDRYAGDNNTNLDPWDKVYLAREGRFLVFPALNIHSFLSAVNTPSAPKRLMGKKGNSTASACLSFVSVGPEMIPFTAGGKPIELGTPKGDVDKKSGLYLHRSVARLAKGIPNPKVRPTLPTPWELTFEISIYPNKEIQEQQVKWLIEEGGYAIGLGTYRGVFGKYEVKAWEVAK